MGISIKLPYYALDSDWKTDLIIRWLKWTKLIDNNSFIIMNNFSFEVGH